MSDYSPPYGPKEAAFDAEWQAVNAKIMELPLATLTVREMLDIIDTFRGMSYNTHRSQYRLDILKIILQSEARHGI